MTAINSKQINTRQFTLDHIGIAVNDLDSAVKKYANFFPCTVSKREIVESQQVEIVFIHLPDSKIELIAPIIITPVKETSNTLIPTSIEKFLQKRGPGLHHLCYNVGDIEAELKNFEALGAELIDKTPRIGAEGKLVAFINPKSFDGVLVELKNMER